MVIADLEAGVGTLSRIKDGSIDLLLVVTEPTVKSMEVARRAVDLARSKRSRVIVVGNKVVDDADRIRLQTAFGPDLHLVPDDPAIREADRDGLAPIDTAPDSPGVRAISDLATVLA